MLFERLVDGLSTRTRGVRLLRLAQAAYADRTVLRRGRGPDAIYTGLAARGVNAPAGNFYALEASRWIGLGDDGAVRAGLAPYTSEGDVDRLRRRRGGASR